VPRNHNIRNEKAAIKKGEVPEDWADKPAKRCQKDLDVRWSEADQKTVRGTVFPTKKHGKIHYGYKNHINVDRTHKLVRRYHVTDAAVQQPGSGSSADAGPHRVWGVGRCGLSVRRDGSQAARAS